MSVKSSSKCGSPLTITLASNRFALLTKLKASRSKLCYPYDNVWKMRLTPPYAVAEKPKKRMRDEAINHLYSSGHLHLNNKGSGSGKEKGNLIVCREPGLDMRGILHTRMSLRYMLDRLYSKMILTRTKYYAE